MLTDFSIKRISGTANFSDLHAICRRYLRHIAGREEVNTAQAIVRFNPNSPEQRPVIEGGNAYFESTGADIIVFREGNYGPVIEDGHIEIA